MKRFLQKYKLLLVIIFSFCFFIFSTRPASGIGEVACLYFEGSAKSTNCKYFEKDGTAPCLDDYGSGGDKDDWMYPDNFVGAYQITRGQNCITAPNYFTDFVDLPDTDSIADLYFNQGDLLMNMDIKGQTLKKTLIKNQLELNIKDTCCIPIQSNKETLSCGQPKIRYNDTEILTKNIADFAVNKLFGSNIYVIDDGKSPFWDHVYCGVTATEVQSQWEHWNMSCSTNIPIETNRDVLKTTLREECEFLPIASVLANSNLYCVASSDTEKYCACPKSRKSDAECYASNYKNKSACEAITDMTQNVCIVCPTPVVTSVTPVVPTILVAPSNLGELNRMGKVDPQILIAKAIQLLMGIIGTIALLMFVYGGVLWMISAGSAEKTKKAMDIMLWAGLGVIVILSSYAIVNFVFGLVR